MKKKRISTKKGKHYVKIKIKKCKYCGKKVNIIGKRKKVFCNRRCMGLYNRGKNNPMYGKKGKNNPNYGRKHTEKTKEKLKGKNHKGKNNPMYGKHHTEKTKKKISEHHKKIFTDKTKHPMYGKKGKLNPKYGISLSLEDKKKKRIARLKYIKKNGGILIGKNEKQILDKWEKIIGYKIIRQYPIIGYSLDGYCKELNIAFEVDEKYHFKVNRELKEKDIRRQKNIEEELNCIFIREIDC